MKLHSHIVAILTLASFADVAIKIALVRGLAKRRCFLGGLSIYGDG